MDLSGIQVKDDCLRREYYERGHGAIMMVDGMKATSSYKNCILVRKDILAVNKDIHVVLCANKVDSINRTDKQKKKLEKAVQLEKWKETGEMEFFVMSTLTSHNIEKPILHLLKKLSGRNDLVLVEEFAAQPSLRCIDEQTKERLEAKVARAAGTHVPENWDHDLHRLLARAEDRSENFAFGG